MFLVEIINFKLVKCDFKLFFCYVVRIFSFVNNMEENGCVVISVLEVFFVMFQFLFKLDLKDNFDFGWEM